MEYEESEPISIDGSELEGGGQIIRVSIALSSLLKQPILIKNIRAKRKNPGLQAQHKNGINLAAQLTNANVKNCDLNSSWVLFNPKSIKGGKFFCDAQTAGSVALLLQASLPIMLFGEQATEVILKGGTNANFAPQIDTTQSVLKPILEKMGIFFDCNIVKRGYFPKGGGQVVVHVNPIVGCIQPIFLEDAGQIESINGYSYVAGPIPIKVAIEMKDSAMKYLKSFLSSLPNFEKISFEILTVKEEKEKATDAGSGIVLFAKTSTGCIIGSSAIGSKKVKPEKVGKDAANEMITEFKSGGCVDSHIQDQAKFVVEEDKDSRTWRIECEGIGYRRNS